VFLAATRVLRGRFTALWPDWHEDRAGVRDLIEQIMALNGSAAHRSSGSELDLRMLWLRWCVLALLTDLVDSPQQAVAIGEPLLADYEQAFGPDYPDTLNAGDNLALAYQAAGRTDEAITVNEQTLAAYERTIGPDHVDTLDSRNNLANFYREAGRPDEAISLEAIALHEVALASRERILGPIIPTR
jgi:tetratricopeptide (TPR) repeat protein